MDNSLGRTTFGSPATGSEPNGGPDPERAGVPSEPPPEIAFKTPFPRPKVGALRNILATIIVGLAIVGLVWYFDSPSSAGSSQSITLTAAASGPAPKTDREAPDFRVQTLDGEYHELSEFRGRPVWINFWASWCPPCRAENPDIQAVYEANKADGLVVLGIAIGEEDGTVRGYVDRTGLTYDIGLDRGTDIAAAYRIVGIPTHFFIDRDGILREWRIGSMSKKTMENKVAEIMVAADGAESSP
ncbi:MAG TPA: TlpA disulfide reductase family protein [Dehalococcoidia bacterium]|nr:TlpA disulfide reductase family protein [Dehalococcoidia bacterium]